MLRLYVGILHALAAAGAVLLGLVALGVTADVVLRNVGLGTVPAVAEISEYSLPAATFLVAPWLLHKAEHVRLDIFVASLPGRLRDAVERVADAIGLAICCVFVWYSVRMIADSMKLGSMVIKSVVFPEWWTFVPVPVCFGLLAVEFVRRMVRPGHDAGFAPHP